MSVKQARKLAAQQMQQLNEGVAAAEAHKTLRDKQTGLGNMFSAFSSKVNVSKAQSLASKLGVVLTPQVLELHSNQEVYNALM
jgi:hypothetical protein